MADDRPIYEIDKNSDEQDPDEDRIRDRRVHTQPYDLVVEALISQIKGGTIFLRPLSERPAFQRRYVWNDILASRLIESILLNVPIPPCYLSQNDDFELDVIDGQQRLFSLYRFVDNQFKLKGLEVLQELNGQRFHEIPIKLQRQFKTHTLRCVLITNESHPEIKFDVFERLNTNTSPLNAQELRNCVHRGQLNDLLKDAVTFEPWLRILGKKEPDKRMRDEELVLRFFAFHIKGVSNYRTPQKHWLNDTAQNGKNYSDERIEELKEVWERSITNCLKWFSADECFRRIPSTQKTKAINRALFDLVMQTASMLNSESAEQYADQLRAHYIELLQNDEFNDLVSRSVDHKKRTSRRFEIWNSSINDILN